MPPGYVKLWREVLDEHFLEHPILFTTWAFCLLKASHNDYTYPDGHIVGPGQLITSRAKVAGGTGQSEKQARTSLQKLEKMGKITVEGARGRYTLITINDWELRQSSEAHRAKDGPNEDQTGANSGPFESQSRAITKNSNSNTNQNPKKRRGEPLDGIADLSSQVVEYLNEETMQNFSTYAKSTRQLIAVLVDHGYGLEDMKSVIDLKTATWLDDDTMYQHLNPKTLFKLSNFESYHGGRVSPEDAELKQQQEAEAAAKAERDRHRQFDEEEGLPWYELLDYIKEHSSRWARLEDDRESLPLLRALVDQGYTVEDLKLLIETSNKGWEAKGLTDRIGKPSWYYRNESVLSWLKWRIRKGFPLPEAGHHHLKSVGTSIEEYLSEVSERAKG